MDRRKFLIGMGAASAGGSILLGSGAFSRVESDRYMQIEVAEDPDAYLGLDACDSAHGNNYVEIDDYGHLYVDISENPNGGEGVNSNSRTWFDDVFQVCNQGKDDAYVYIERDDDWPTVEYGQYEGEPRVDFYLGDDDGQSILGEDNAVELELGECECVGIKTNTHGLDATDVDSLLESIDDTVTIVAGVEEPDVDPEMAFFEVTEIDPVGITVGPGESFDLDATITNIGGAAGEQDVELLIDGDLVDSQSLALEPDDAETVTFEDVPTEDLEEGEYELMVRTDDDQDWVPLVIGVDFIDVLYLGGVEDGATHYSEVLYQEIAEPFLEHGVVTHYTERQEDLNEETLGHYDAIMLYGNRLEATEAQIDALEDFVEDGGGFVPVHSASASFTGDFGDTPDDLAERYISLVGGAFDWHGADVMTTERVQPDHPIYEGVDEIEAYEETYRHYGLGDDIEVLAYGAGGDYGEDENEPFTWVRHQGDGRVFYTAWGHGVFTGTGSYETAREEMNTWEVAAFIKLLENGIRWASGNDDTIGTGQVVESPEYTHVEEYGHEEVPYYQSDVPERVAENNSWVYVQDPMDVPQSLAHTITPAEFEMHYFVSEDILPEGLEGEILDMAFDAKGRCWISLTLDYPNNAGDGNDKIVICEDTDGDGIADEFTVFAEDLSIPLSIIPHQDGVLVSEVQSFEENDGRVVYLGDEDGDDVADVEETLFTGFGTGDTHAGLNQLYRGHDNWIYGVVGYEGLSPDIDEDLSLSQDLFRFKPDGSQIEYIGSGASNMAGVKTNEEGLVFCSSATAGSNVTTYAAIPAAYYDDVNEFEGITTTDIRGEELSRIEYDNRILPVNDRYRMVDQQDGFTAVTDQEFYTAREFPEQYWNSTIFVGEPTGNLMATFYVEQDGASYVSNNYHNLVGSNDEWVSPMYVNTGPDGMLWMMDFYDFVIQHNPTPSDWGYSNGEGNAYVTNKRDDEHSRLYRVTTGADVDVHGQDLSDASPEELVEALTDDIMFWRQTAQRKLVERGETDVVSDLIDLIESEELDEIGLDPGAIHAIWTLDGLDTIEDDALDAVYGALEHTAAGVRLNALRALPGTEDLMEAIFDLDLINDDDGRVQMWALLKLGETPMSYEAGEAVYDMITQEEHYEQDLLLDAATVAAARHHEGFIDSYLAEHDPDDLETLGPNLLENPSFEEGEGDEPDDWHPEHLDGAEPEFTWDDEMYQSGGRSVRIDADEGATAAWRQEVFVNWFTEYEIGAYVRTENFDAGDGLGIGVNIDEEDEPISGTVSVEETDGWVHVSGIWNSGFVGFFGDDVQFDCLFGASEEATGTAWWDDVYLAEPVEPAGFHGVYTRVADHVEAMEDDDDDDEIPDEALDPDETIEMEGANDSEIGWRGVAPEQIEGEVNPTLTLVEDGEYTLEWTNTDGQIHWFAIHDDDGNTVAESDQSNEEGETVTLEFTATADLAEYECPPHPDTMSGEIDIVEPED